MQQEFGCERRKLCLASRENWTRKVLLFLDYFVRLICFWQNGPCFALKFAVFASNSIDRFNQEWIVLVGGLKGEDIRT
ncbi:MAG: hypothetical protein D6743_10375 [Calditrichaeota bacterium]|nr:MAG: hypothetical protein D6743_10375 [Calditrichota bacterium]